MDVESIGAAKLDSLGRLESFAVLITSLVSNMQNHIPHLAKRETMPKQFGVYKRKDTKQRHLPKFHKFVRNPVSGRNREETLG